MKPPAVTVVIAAHNAEPTLAAAVHSALDQSLPPAEILVVDDGSEDATAACAAGFGPPLRYLRQPHRGPATARNTGARAAAGEWLAFLDADDRWPRRHLETEWELASATGAEVVFSDAQVIADKRAAASWLERSGHHWLQAHPGGELAHPYRRLLEHGCFVLTSTLILRRTALLAAGGFDESFPPGAEDLDLWLRLAPTTRWAFNAATRIERAEGNGNLSARSATMAQGAAMAWSKALRFAPPGLARYERRLLERRRARAEWEQAYWSGHTRQGWTNRWQAARCWLRAQL